MAMHIPVGHCPDSSLLKAALNTKDSNVSPECGPELDKKASQAGACVSQQAAFLHGLKFLLQLFLTLSYLWLIILSQEQTRKLEHHLCAQWFYK